MMQICRVFVVLCLSVSVPAFANVIYTYTGNNFDTFLDDTPPAGAYTNSMRVTGSFELAAPLPAGLPLTAITPLSFSFSDGRLTRDNTNSPAIINVGTDLSGSINAWSIMLRSPFILIIQQGEQTHNIVTESAASALTRDQGHMVECITHLTPTSCVVGIDDGIRRDSPGVWSVPAGDVPEAATLALLGLGLAGLGWSRRRLQ